MEYSNRPYIFLLLIIVLCLSSVKAADNYTLTAYEDNGVLKYYNFQTGVVNNTGYATKGGDSIGGIADIDNDSHLDISFKDQNYNIDYYEIEQDDVTATGGSTDGSDTGGGWTGDINSDGDVDIVYRDANQNLVYYDSGSGTIKDTGSQTYDVGGLADIDDDSNLEVFQERTSNSLGYHDFETSSQTSLSPTVGAYVGGAGDMNDDGDIDVAHMGDNSNIHIFDTGSNSDTDTGISVNAIGDVGDVDLDGSLEIAFISENELKFYNSDTSEITSTSVPAGGSVGGIKIVTNSTKEPLICDSRGPKNECISDKSHDVNGQEISIDSKFEAKETAVLEASTKQTQLSITNTSIFSGVWRGNFNIISEKTVIKSGAKFRPKNGRIILN